MRYTEYKIMHNKWHKPKIIYQFPIFQVGGDSSAGQSWWGQSLIGNSRGGDNCSIDPRKIVQHSLMAGIV